jgi:cytochrome c oxidase subunit 2
MEEEEKATSESVQTEETKKGGLGPFLFVLVVFVIILAVGLWFATRGRKSVSENNQVRPVGNLESQEESTSGSREVRTIEVEAGMYYFKPSEIKVKKGEKVRIVLKNVEGMHDFVIDELKVNSGIIQSGQTTEFEFVTEKTGEFEYYCSVSNHRAMGMKGALVVGE